MILLGGNNRLFSEVQSFALPVGALIFWLLLQKWSQFVYVVSMRRFVWPKLI